jgi:hypothetical protein
MAQNRTSVAECLVSTRARSLGLVRLWLWLQLLSSCWGLVHAGTIPLRRRRRRRRRLRFCCCSSFIRAGGAGAGAGAGAGLVVLWNCLTIIRSNGGFITGCTANGDCEVLRARLDLNFRGLLIRDSSVHSLSTV